jgi:hypothetical protein
MRAPAHPLPPRAAPAVTFSLADLATLADVPRALPVVHLAAAQFTGPANDDASPRLLAPTHRDRSLAR